MGERVGRTGVKRRVSRRKGERGQRGGGQGGGETGEEEGQGEGGDGDVSPVARGENVVAKWEKEEKEAETRRRRAAAQHGDLLKMQLQELISWWEKKVDGRLGPRERDPFQGKPEEEKAAKEELFETVLAVVRLLPAFPTECQGSLGKMCDVGGEVCERTDVDLYWVERVVAYNPPEVLKMMRTEKGIKQLEVTMQERKVRASEEVVAQMISNSAAQLREGGVETEAFVLSLKCPLSLTRIKVPVRGKKCSHESTFDLASYLRLNQGLAKNVKRAWRCPVCYQQLLWSELFLDGFMQKILDETSDEVDEVEVFPDGRWRVVENGGGEDGSCSESDEEERMIMIALKRREEERRRKAEEEEKRKKEEEASGALERGTEGDGVQSSAVGSGEEGGRRGGEGEGREDEEEDVIETAGEEGREGMREGVREGEGRGEGCEEGNRVEEVEAVEVEVNGGYQNMNGVTLEPTEKALQNQVEGGEAVEVAGGDHQVNGGTLETTQNASRNRMEDEAVEVAGGDHQVNGVTASPACVTGREADMGTTRSVLGDDVLCGASQNGTARETASLAPILVSRDTLAPGSVLSETVLSCSSQTVTARDTDMVTASLTHVNGRTGSEPSVQGREPVTPCSTQTVTARDTDMVTAASSPHMNGLEVSEPCVRGRDMVLAGVASLDGQVELARFSEAGKGGPERGGSSSEAGRDGPAAAVVERAAAVVVVGGASSGVALKAPQSSAHMDGQVGVEGFSEAGKSGAAAAVVGAAFSGAFRPAGDAVAGMACEAHGRAEGMDGMIEEKPDADYSGRAGISMGVHAAAGMACEAHGRAEGMDGMIEEKPAADYSGRGLEEKSFGEEKEQRGKGRDLVVGSVVGGGEVKKEEQVGEGCGLLVGSVVGGGELTKAEQVGEGCDLLVESVVGGGEVGEEGCARGRGTSVGGVKRKRDGDTGGEGREVERKDGKDGVSMGGSAGSGGSGSSSGHRKGKKTVMVVRDLHVICTKEEAAQIRLQLEQAQQGLQGQQQGQQGQQQGQQGQQQGQQGQGQEQEQQVQGQGQQGQQQQRVIRGVEEGSKGGATASRGVVVALRARGSGSNDSAASLGRGGVMEEGGRGEASASGGFVVATRARAKGSSDSAAASSGRGGVVESRRDTRGTVEREKRGSVSSSVTVKGAVVSTRGGTTPGGGKTAVGKSGAGAKGAAAKTAGAKSAGTAKAVEAEVIELLSDSDEEEVEEKGGGDAGGAAGGAASGGGSGGAGGAGNGGGGGGGGAAAAAAAAAVAAAASAGGGASAGGEQREGSGQCKRACATCCPKPSFFPPVLSPFFPAFCLPKQLVRPASKGASHPNAHHTHSHLVPNQPARPAPTGNPAPALNPALKNAVVSSPLSSIASSVPSSTPSSVPSSTPSSLTSATHSVAALIPPVGSKQVLTSTSLPAAAPENSQK
ncbi:unnamed protein product [Closterium sp. NIES-65]|nr:unnamed protein product [Closterium sp. NIES-65]